MKETEFLTAETQFRLVGALVETEFLTAANSVSSCGCFDRNRVSNGQKLGLGATILAPNITPSRLRRIGGRGASAGRVGGRRALRQGG